MNRRIMIAALAIAVAVGIYAFFFYGSEADAVRRAVQRTAAAVKVIPDENPVMRATRVRGELNDTVAKDVSVTIPELGDLARGRDALTGTVIAAAQAWSTADIAMTLAKVQLDPDNTAFVDATAVLSASRHGGSTDRDTRRCTFRLRKLEGKWRIEEITVYPKEPS